MILEELIKNLDKQNIKFYLSNFKWQEVGEIISAYANNNGGILFFGIMFDGIKTIPKGFPYKFKVEELLPNLNNSETISYGVEKFKGHDIYYIKVSESSRVIKFHDIAYTLDVTGGVSELVTKNVFLSYSWVDENIADMLEQDLNAKYKDRICLTRDRNSLGYKDSLEEFMQRVKDHDYVIAIISDSYLKSEACLYEVSELMRDRNYFEKLLFITVTKKDMQYYKDIKNENNIPNIYGTGYTKYKIYWQEKKRELTEVSSSLDLSNKSLLANDAKQIDSINYNLDDLFCKLRDSYGKGFSQFKEENYIDFDKFFI